MANSIEKKVKRFQRQKKQNAVEYFDYSLLAVVIFLLCFGLVMLYSTTFYSAQIKFGNGMYFFMRQAVISLGSFFVMILISKIDYHVWAKLAKAGYFFAMFLMLLVLTPLGYEAYGSRRWLQLPFGQTLQPSEVMKVAIVIFIPLIICQAGKKMSRKEGILKVFLWGAAAAAGVFFFTDNLSTAIIVMGMVCIMIYVVHPKLAPFVVLTGAGVAGIAIVKKILNRVLTATTVSKQFRLKRILVWLAPEKYADDGGFQVMQGLYAIGAGGLFGKGLGNSTQKMIIPEAQNDMILAIICEELGVCGAVIVLLLFGILLYRLMFIAKNAPDAYGALMVTGVFAHISLQVLFNVAVVLQIIPTTGITLPFISYGGTSILFLMAEMGLALSVSRTIQLEE